MNAGEVIGLVMSATKTFQFTEFSKHSFLGLSFDNKIT